jgi:hypothetical protein
VPQQDSSHSPTKCLSRKRERKKETYREKEREIQIKVMEKSDGGCANDEKFLYLVTSEKKRC